jgi:hypothetical protein
MEWLRKIVKRACSHCLNGSFTRRIGGDEDDGDLAIERSDFAKQFETVMFRKKDIQQQYARIFFFDHPKSALSVGRL